LMNRKHFQLCLIIGNRASALRGSILRGFALRASK
jgi:hypothetical protein